MANINWQNLPSETTPINSTNLNVMSAGLLNVSNEVDDTYRVNLLETKNLFGTVWENGDLGSNGVPSASSQYMRTADYIVVKPSAQYTLKISASNTQIVVYYYSNGTFLNREYVQNSDTYTFTIPANCNAIKFRLSGTSLTLTNTIVNEGSTALPYEPYIQNQIVVDNEKYSDTLNIGNVVDSRNRLNILKSNNLFDILGTWEASNPITTGGMTYTLNSDGSLTISNTSTGYSGAYGRPYNETKPFITLKANHTYRLLVKITNKTSDKFSAVYMGVANDNLNNKVAVREISSSGIKYTDFSFTSDQVLTQYSIIGANNSGASETGMKMEIALYDITGLSTPPTTYEPYITPSIYVDNEEIYGQQYCNSSINSDATITSSSSTYSTQQFLLDKISAYGNFSLSSNSIVIGKGINQILVSLNINIYNATDNHFYNPSIRLYRNGTRIDQVNCPRYMRNIQGSYSISPYIFDVQENDVIKCEIQIGSANETFKISKDGTNLFIQKLK